MSGSVKIERDDISAQELRQLAGRVKDGRVSRRLLAKALVLEGGSQGCSGEFRNGSSDAARLGSSL